MKHNTSLKGLLLAVVALFGVVSLSAQNKLSIEPANFISHDVVKLQVNFDKVDPVAGMDFQVALPDFLEFVGRTVERNEARFTSNTTISFNPNNGKVLIASFAETELQGDNGPLLYIPVKVKNGYNTELSGDITVNNITFTTWNGKESWSQDAFTVDAVYNPYKIEFAPVADNLVINPGSPYDLGVSIKADCNIIGFQAVVTVPEGYTIGERGVLSDRCPGDANMSIRKGENNTYRLVYYTLSNSPMTGNDGLAFTLKVIASKNAPENGVIGFKDIVVSYEAGKSANANAFSVNVINGANALAAANAKIAELKKALDDALSTIATECPDVKDQFTGSEISSQISTLEQAVKDAYDNGTLTPNYEEVMKPAADITAATEKLVADAKAAQAAHNDNETAKANADKAIADLEKALTDALSTIATDCPAVKDQFTGSEVTAQIEALKNAVAEAYTSGTLAANYDEVMKPAVDITKATEKLVADAKAAQLAYDGEQIAKANADSRIADLEKALAAALSTIATDCPDVKDNFTGEGISAQIEAIKNAVAEQYAASTLVANYDKTVTAPAEAVVAAINKLVADAKAAQAPVTANKEAYAKANAELTRLEGLLSDALAKVAAECPAVKDQFNGADVTAKINALRNEVNKANATGTLATTYDYIVPQASADIETAIEKLVADAKAAQIAHDGEETAKANADKAVADLEAALKSALSTIATDCPAVKDQFTGAEITAQIEALKNAVAKAYEGGTLAANYGEVMAPAADITKATEKLVADAKAAQAALEGEEAALKQAEQEIEALKAELKKAVSEIAQSCPDVKNDFDGKNVEAMISSLNNDVKEAANNKALAANYDEIMAQAKSIREAISQLVADAKAAQAKYEDDARRAANEKAYNEVVEQLDMLQDELDTMLEKVSVEYPGATVASETLAAQRAINDARIAAQKAYNAVADSGEYDYEVDTDAIRKLIDAILDKAIASGIDSITNDEGEVRYFDLQGVEVKNPVPGSIVIKVSADGTRTKVLVK